VSFLSKKLQGDLTDKLFEAILLLRNKEECYSFFEDVGTIAEIKAFAQRLEVAKMLDQGKTYREIHENTGASEATISRVSRSLNYGADGYRLILERLRENAEGESK
jgi:TrpR-related protein YerC/YecD